MGQDSMTPVSSAAGNLNTRVAKRIYGLFALCTLLPLSIFAWLSLTHVTSQLEEQAADRLQETCKSNGMTVVERLGNVVSDLSLILAYPSTTPLRALTSGPTETRDRLMARVEWIGIGNGKGEWLSGSSKPQSLPRLSKQDLDHLNSKKKLLAMAGDGIGRSHLILVIANGRLGNDHFLLAKIRPAYLWGDGSLLPPNMDIIGLTESGRFLHATSDLPETQLAVSKALRQASTNGEIESIESNQSFLTSYRTMYTRPQFLRNFVIASTQERAIVLAPIAAFKRLFVLFATLMLCSTLYASLVLIRRIMGPIGILTAAARSIGEGEFSTRVDIQSHDEFQALGEAFNGMVSSLESHAETMEALNRIGVALTAEPSSKRLVAIAAESALSVTSADLVIMYEMGKGGRLSTSCVRSELKGNSAWTDLIEQGLDPIQDSAISLESRVSTTATTGRSIHVEDLTHSKVEVPDAYRVIEELSGSTFASELCIPMKNHDNETIGVMQLFHAQEHGNDSRPFSVEDRHAAESLASQAAVALTKNRLVEEFQEMFESLTELIATAIDEKSPYTGDHCRRVPILTMMMTEAVCAVTTGPFADFNLSPDELYELKLAALLHDCGKVTTPDHIIDKATKLEKVFDRIQLIDHRFEIVKLRLRLDHLDKCLTADSENQISLLTESLTRKIETLEADRDFIRQCNVGQEFMTTDDQTEIHSIAKRYTWTDSAGTTSAILTEDEIENLCVKRGTLTAKDREIVNYHIVATIKMLEKLPFPKRLAKVPEIAGAHHEKMDGTGYPKGLKKSEITVQGRILGICDLFEALTAKDRPYKAGKKLSETFEILGKLKAIGHVDPDLFDLFVESGVYLRFANEFLDPDQIDEFDTASILAVSPATA